MKLRVLKIRSIVLLLLLCVVLTSIGWVLALRIIPSWLEVDMKPVVEFSSGPIASVTLPSRFVITSINTDWSHIEADVCLPGRWVSIYGGRSLSIIVAKPGSFFDRAIIAGTLPSAPSRSITTVNGIEFKVPNKVGEEGFIAIAGELQLVVIGYGDWSEEAAMRVLEGIYPRIQDAEGQGDDKQGQPGQRSDNVPRRP